jgi:hypothetical protein
MLWLAMRQEDQEEAGKMKQAMVGRVAVNWHWHCRQSTGTSAAVSAAAVRLSWQLV